MPGPMPGAMPVQGPMVPPPGYPMPAPLPPQPAPIRDLPNDKEALGEYLYPLVEQRQPVNAAKITGMLLEMELEQIHNIIRDQAQLDKWIGEALRVLSKTEQA